MFLKKYIPEFLVIGPLAFFYLLICYDGNLQSPDSGYYLKIAESLLLSGKYYGPGGNPIVYWPPLYAVVLIPAYYSVLYTIVLQCLLMVIHQLIWLRILKILFDSKEHFLCAVLGLNTVILMVSVFVWSEMLFMVLMAVAILYALKYQQSGRRMNLVWLAMALCLAQFTRYAGVFYVPGFVLMGLVWFQKKQLYSYLLSLSLGSLGIVIWCFIHFYVMSNMQVFGELVPRWSLWDNMHNVNLELLRNLFPARWIAWDNWAVLFFPLLLISVYSIRDSKPLLGLSLLMMVYLCIWYVIPADVDNLGRFVAPVLPVFLVLIYENFKILIKNPVYAHLFLVLKVYLVVFSLMRIISNTANWSSLF